MSSQHFYVDKNESLDGISLSRMLLFIWPLITSFSTLERWLSKFYCADKTNLIRHHQVRLGESSLALCTSVCVWVLFIALRHWSAWFKHFIFFTVLSLSASRRGSPAMSQRIRQLVQGYRKTLYFLSIPRLEPRTFCFSGVWSHLSYFHCHCL